MNGHEIIRSLQDYDKRATQLELNKRVHDAIFKDFSEQSELLSELFMGLAGVFGELEKSIQLEAIEAAIKYINNEAKNDNPKIQNFSSVSCFVFKIVQEKLPERYFRYSENIKIPNASSLFKDEFTPEFFLDCVIEIAYAVNYIDLN